MSAQDVWTDPTTISPDKPIALYETTITQAVSMYETGTRYTLGRYRESFIEMDDGSRMADHRHYDGYSETEPSRVLVLADGVRLGDDGTELRVFVPTPGPEGLCVATIGGQYYDWYARLSELVTAQRPISDPRYGTIRPRAADEAYTTADALIAQLRER